MDKLQDDLHTAATLLTSHCWLPIDLSTLARSSLSEPHAYTVELAAKLAAAVRHQHGNPARVYSSCCVHVAHRLGRKPCVLTSVVPLLYFTLERLRLSLGMCKKLLHRWASSLALVKPKSLFLPVMKQPNLIVSTW